jgi:hypothetical protein
MKKISKGLLEKGGRKMSIFPLILIFLAIVGLLVTLIILRSRKGISGIKVMLLGINVTLLGGIIAVDPDTNLAGIEYLIAVLGLVICVAVVGKKD